MNAFRPHRRTTPLIAAMAVAAVVAALAPAASAQPVGPEPLERVAPRDVDRLVAALDSEDLQTRRDAVGRLRVSRALPESRLIEILRTGDLSVQQHIGLHEALRGRFEESPRAALGFGFGRGPNGEVPISRVIEGFPAVIQGAIRIDDVFVTVDGVDLAALPNDSFRHRQIRISIISRDPGDLLPARLRRTVDGVPTEFDAELRLGAYEDLGGNPVISLGELSLAWAARKARLGIPDEPTRRLRASDAPEGGWERVQREGRIRLPDRRTLVGPVNGGFESQTTAQAQARRAQVNAARPFVQRPRARPERARQLQRVNVPAPDALPEPNPPGPEGVRVTRVVTSEEAGDAWAADEARRLVRRIAELRRGVFERRRLLEEPARTASEREQRAVAERRIASDQAEIVELTDRLRRVVGGTASASASDDDAR